MSCWLANRDIQLARCVEQKPKTKNTIAYLFVQLQFTAELQQAGAAESRRAIALSGDRNATVQSQHTTVGSGKRATHVAKSRCRGRVDSQSRTTGDTRDSGQVTVVVGVLL